jgi:hypothetical protein
MFVEIIRLGLQQNTPPVFLLNCNNIVHSFIPCPNCCTPQYFQLYGHSQEIFCFRIFHESSSPKPLKIVVDIGGKFARGVNNNVGKYVTIVNYTGGKLAAGNKNIGGKFATGVNDTGGK